MESNLAIDFSCIHHYWKPQLVGLKLRGIKATLRRKEKVKSTSVQFVKILAIIGWAARGVTWRILPLWWKRGNKMLLFFLLSTTPCYKQLLMLPSLFILMYRNTKKEGKENHDNSIINCALGRSSPCSLYVFSTKVRNFIPSRSEKNLLMLMFQL